MIRHFTLALGILALLVTPRLFAADSQPASQTVKIVNVGTSKILGLQDDGEDDSDPGLHDEGRIEPRPALDHRKGWQFFKNYQP